MALPEYSLSAARRRVARVIEPTPLATMPPRRDGVRRIAYYAHHHGSGHWRRAAEIARILGKEFQVLVLTSAEIPENVMPANVTVQKLPLDIVKDHTQPRISTHHYTPAGSEAKIIGKRMMLISRAFYEFEPEVMISDVSAELSQFALLSGVPPVARRLPGVRVDDAHLAQYRDAARMIAYYPQAVEHDSDQYPFMDRTEYVGLPMPPDLKRALAQYEFRPPTPDGGRVKVVYLTSLGGDGVNLQGLNSVADQTGDLYDWEVVGIVNKFDTVAGRDAPTCQPVANVKLHGVVDDPGKYLSDAGIIVTSGGSDAVRDVAAALKPVVIVPEQRPFREQHEYALGLQAATNANARAGQGRGVQVAMLHESQDWNAILARAANQYPPNLVEAVFVSPDVFKAGLLRAFAFAGSRGVGLLQEPPEAADRSREQVLGLMREPTISWDFPLPG